MYEEHLFSKANNAYQIGISEPKILNDIGEEVPETILNGFSVFLSKQNAFD